jgi:hypothetical protein
VLSQCRRVPSSAVGRYLDSDDADPHGYADDIPVLPHRGEDYITRMLTANGGL